jgi:hypothetical protein
LSISQVEKGGRKNTNQLSFFVKWALTEQFFQFFQGSEARWTDAGHGNTGFGGNLLISVSSRGDVYHFYKASVPFRQGCEGSLKLTAMIEVAENISGGGFNFLGKRLGRLVCSQVVEGLTPCDSADPGRQTRQIPNVIKPLV